MKYHDTSYFMEKISLALVYPSRILESAGVELGATQINDTIRHEVPDLGSWDPIRK